MHPQPRVRWVVEYSCQLNSPTSKWQREDYKRQKAQLAAVTKKRFDALQALENRLRAVENESSFGWWELNLAFLADENGFLSQELKSDLTETALWENIPQPLRGRLLQTAVRYLTENKLSSSSWIGTNTFHRPAAAAYRALRLILKMNRELFFNLPAVVWRNWCARILVSFNEGSEEQEVRTIIAERAYELAPERVYRVLTRLLRKGSDFDARNAIRTFDKCYDDKYGAFLWAIFGKLVPGKVREVIIRFLAKKKCEPVVNVLLGELGGDTVLPNAPYSEEEFVAGVSSLLQSDPSAIWAHFSRFKSKNSTLAVRIVKSFDYESSFISKMDEMDLAEFFIWTYREIPPPSKDKTGRARWVGPEDEVDHLRHGIMRRLSTIGTLSAVAAARRMPRKLLRRLGSNIR
jgi:hypothetical protein